jgi:hypothetical protein
MTRPFIGALVVWATLVMFQTTAETQTPQTTPGGSLSGLTPVEFSEFRLGLTDFSEVETAEEGLGPAFNGHELRGVPQRAGHRRWRRDP